jgi:hypothetical protein
MFAPSHDGVEPEHFGQVGQEKRLRHGTGMRETGRFHEHVVESFLFFEQVAEALDQVFADAAAEAAIVQLENFLVGADDQLVVYARLAEFIDDDGAMVTVVLGQQMAEQSRLARAEKTGQHGDRNRFFPFHDRNFAFFCEMKRSLLDYCVRKRK